MELISSETPEINIPSSILFRLIISAREAGGVPGLSVRYPEWGDSNPADILIKLCPLKPSTLPQTRVYFDFCKALQFLIKCDNCDFHQIRSGKLIGKRHVTTFINIHLEKIDFCPQKERKRRGLLYRLFSQPALYRFCYCIVNRRCISVKSFCYGFRKRRLQYNITCYGLNM